jgi:hypothetical protein
MRRSVQDDREFFFKVGKTAADKFYINEDNQKQKMMSLKGDAKFQSDFIKDRYNKSINDRQTRMANEAKQREEQDRAYEQER